MGSDRVIRLQRAKDGNLQDFNQYRLRNKGGGGGRVASCVGAVSDNARVRSEVELQLVIKFMVRALGGSSSEFPTSHALLHLPRLWSLRKRRVLSGG